ncbi:MAG: NADP-dependent oxidoreductase [Bacteroidales bacterium]|jgi:NADPH:quinone reductase-like Zn-dependent oxidoreductase|nr:NADP-dependent oxidoreductase [Bacteroidales bacterium]
MKAIVLKQFGGIENFSLKEIPEPQIKSGQVLIRVEAIGINPVDIKTRKGGGQAAQYKDTPEMVIGWDVAGVITRVAGDVKDFSPGDEVFGTINFPGQGGAYAEYAAAPANQLARKPANISMPEAAASTLSALTAWQALMYLGHIRKGDRVLIHGGAGGVGNFAVQIAKKTGCHVITTASASDAGFVKNLGANEVIDYKTQKFEELISNIDFILDPIGGENFVRSLKVLKPEGTIVLISSPNIEETNKIAKEQHVRNYKPMMMHSDGEDMGHIAGMLADGSLKVHVDKTFPFDKIPEAHNQLENGKVRGKIVALA